MPISVSTNRSSFKRSKSLIVAERKQFPLVLAHAVTIHKFQGSTIDYMTGNLDRAREIRIEVILLLMVCYILCCLEQKVVINLKF